jgi:hypothetical protein
MYLVRAPAAGSEPVIRPAVGPGLGLYLTEPARGLADLAALPLAAPLLVIAPRGDGHGVLVLPGLLGSDMSTAPLRRLLGWLGYDVHGWDLGRNVGPTDAVIAGLPHALEALVERTGGPVSLIGWSLGGIYAREMAREQPVRPQRPAAEPRRTRLPAAQPPACPQRSSTQPGPARPTDPRHVHRAVLPARRHRAVAELHRAGDVAAPERRGPLQPPRIRRGSRDLVGDRRPADRPGRAAACVPAAGAAPPAVSWPPVTLPGRAVTAR